MAQASVQLKVEGMTCQGCVRSVEKKLSGLKGVESVNVDLSGGKAAVTFDDSQIQPSQLIGAIEQIGFHAQ
jgi:copper ion binding protein